MHGIMLVNQAGETVASVGWDQLDGDVAMFGGFVSAVQMFVGRVASGTEVKDLSFGDMRLVLGKSGEYHVVTLHEADAPNAVSENQEVVKLLGDNDGVLNEGILDLIQEIVSRNEGDAEKIGESVKEWTESQMDKAKKSASDWGKTVF